MSLAAHVSIDEAALDRVVPALQQQPTAARRWREPPHWWDDQNRDSTAMYVLLLDALNFSFWGDPKWRVETGGGICDGYWALAASLRRAFEQGLPLADPGYLFSTASARELLKGVDNSLIPLLDERQRILKEVGKGLQEAGTSSFRELIQQCRGSASRLIHLVADLFPSFRDVTTYGGRKVPFYKRAQILVSDLWGAFDGRDEGKFEDLECLTMFADYKVPQILHDLGILKYSDTLRQTLERREIIPYGDSMEVEIRAGSVQAVEALADRFALHGQRVLPFLLDWQLWELAQNKPLALPYHHTRSIYY